MPDIPAAVRAELDRRQWSVYQLAEAAKPLGVRPDTVYRLLRGKSINLKDLGLIFDVFGWPLPPTREGEG